MTNKLTGPGTSDTALARDRILFSREQSKNSILDSIFGQNGIYGILTAKMLHLQSTNLRQVGFPPKQTLSKDLCNWFIQEVTSGSPESRAGKGHKEGKEDCGIANEQVSYRAGQMELFSLEHPGKIPIKSCLPRTVRKLGFLFTNFHLLVCEGCSWGCFWSTSHESGMLPRPQKVL